MQGEEAITQALEEDWNPRLESYHQMNVLGIKPLPGLKDSNKNKSFKATSLREGNDGLTARDLMKFGKQSKRESINQDAAYKEVIYDLP